MADTANTDPYGTNADAAAAFSSNGTANAAAISALIESYGKAQGRTDADLASTAGTDIPYWSAKVAAGGPSQLAFWQGRMADPPGKGTNAAGAPPPPQQPLAQNPMPVINTGQIAGALPSPQGGALGQVNVTPAAQSANNQAAISAALQPPAPANMVPQ
jgi:hypothetical protein